MLRALRAVAVVACLVAGTWIATPAAARADPCHGDQDVHCQFPVAVPGQDASTAEQDTPRGGPRTSAPPVPRSRPSTPAPATPTTPYVPLCGVDDTLPQGCRLSDDPVANLNPTRQPQNPAPQATVDPAVVARTAVARLSLTTPTIEVTAAQGPEGGAVGVPVWVWITPGASTTGPATSTAIDGPVSVTATAIVQSVDWDMGDPAVSMGACGAGIPHDWASGSLERAPGECWFAGYDRSRAGTTVTISATVNWAIQWQGGGMAAGMSGQEQASTVGSVQLPIRDIRTVSTDPSGGG